MASLLASAVASTALGCAQQRRRIVPLPATRPASDGLTPPVFVPALAAYIVTPAGWKLDKETGDDRFQHRVWISPTGRTAYGIILFKMPFPVGHDLALRYGFLAEMKKSAGEANLISKSWDDSIEGLRFEVEGGPFYLRSNFFVRGMEGWAVYAGTRRDQPVEPSELKVAEAAREGTIVNAEPPSP